MAKMNPVLAKKLAESKASNTGDKLTDREGDYLCEIAETTCSDAFFSGTRFVVEAYIIEAKPQTEGAVLWPVGKRVTIANFLLDGKDKAGLAQQANTKKYGCALFGVDFQTATTDEMSEAIAGGSDDDLTRGMLIHANTVKQRIQSGPNAGTMGTFVNFGHVEGQDAETVAARRKARAEKAAK